MRGSGADMDRGARWLVHVMVLAATVLAWVALSSGIGNTLRGVERDG